MNFQTVGNFFPGNFSGTFTFNSLADFASNKPFSFTQAFAGDGTDGPLSKPNVNEYAFYAQDSWRFNDRLTLNYGLRYDYFDYAQPSVHNPDPGLAAIGLDTGKINLDGNNIGPRFGFAYRLDNTGRTVVRGGYGIYYGRTPSILTGTAITQNGIQVQTYTFSSNFPVYPNVLSAPPTLSRRPDIYVFSPDYVQPLTQQWSFNLERQIGSSYAVTLGYLGVRGEHLTRTRDVNLYPAVPVQGTIAGVGAVTFYRHPGRVDPNFGRISVFDSGADSIYHGVFVQLTKRFSENFQVQTSYTWSKVIDDAPDFTSVVVSVDDPKNAQDTLQPNLDRGVGNADIRHRFVFSGVWDINYAKSLQNRVARAILGGYQLSTISSIQSGRPYNVAVSSDVNNDGNTRTDRPPYGRPEHGLRPEFSQRRYARDARLPAVCRARQAQNDVRSFQPYESRQLQLAADHAVHVQRSYEYLLARVGLPDAHRHVRSEDPATGGQDHVLIWMGTGAWKRAPFRDRYRPTVAVAAGKAARISGAAPALGFARSGCGRSPARLRSGLPGRHDTSRNRPGLISNGRSGRASGSVPCAVSRRRIRWRRPSNRQRCDVACRAAPRAW